MDAKESWSEVKGGLKSSQSFQKKRIKFSKLIGWEALSEALWNQ